MKLRKWIGWIVGILFSLAFFWMVVLKLILRLVKTAPCCADTVSWVVDNPFRRLYISSLLDWVGIQKGERVLELGPGPGVFTVDAARRLGPQGCLIVVDLQQKMIDKANERIAQAGLANVETYVSGAYELPLENASLDRAFLVAVLSEIPDQSCALSELHRVLKPGGVLSISEELLDPDYPLPSETIRRVEAKGFRLKQRFGNFWLYTLNFEKTSQLPS